MRASDRVPLPGDRLAEQWRRHGEYCDRVGAPLYGELMRGMAADLLAGGPVADLVVGRHDAPVGDVLQLRILASLHRVVLAGGAPDLVPWYPNLRGARIAGTGPRRAGPQGAWPVAREVIAANLGILTQDLDRVPQTNEAGRSAALAVGLSAACAEHGLHRVRLLELGASAGVNLAVDRYRVTGAQFAWGPADSRVRLENAVLGEPGWAAPGEPPVRIEIVTRRGCDLNPVDPVSADGRLRLLSFVWPDHLGRFERLRAALDLLGDLEPRDRPQVDRAPLGQWLESMFADPEGEPDASVLTVVWHSIVMQYVGHEEQQQVLELLRRAARRGPVAHVSMEAPIAPYESAPELRVNARLIAHVGAHGVPVTLV